MNTSPKVCDCCKRNPNKYVDIDVVYRTATCWNNYDNESAVLIRAKDDYYCIDCAGKIIEEMRNKLDAIAKQTRYPGGFHR